MGRKRSVGREAVMQRTDMTLVVWGGKDGGNIWDGAQCRIHYLPCTFSELFSCFRSIKVHPSAGKQFVE